MNESTILREAYEQGFAEGALRCARKNLLQLLEGYLDGSPPAAIVELVNAQNSVGRIRKWFKAAAEAKSPEQFLAVFES